MTEIGVVNKIEGEIAVVSVVRTDMCGKCEKKDCFENCEIKLFPFESRKIETYAINSVNAKLGDMVRIYTPSSKIYAYAFLVFIFPILAAFLGYYIINLFGMKEIFSSIAFFVFLGTSYIVVCILDRKIKRCKPFVLITEVINIKN